MMFWTLRWRLLISYLSVIVAILGISIITVYEFFAYRLYQKLDNQMITLADAAAHSLLIIKDDPKAVGRRIPRNLDYDEDLDIPWQDLQKNHQAVEWFDANGQLLGNAGRYIPQLPFDANVKTSQNKNIRSVIIPVYSASFIPERKRLQGYVRVSESTENLQEELDTLMWGFSGGGLIAVILSGIGSWWLTKQSLKPIEQSFQQLKQFTADASHELRSPLTVVKTSVQVMSNHSERFHPKDQKKLKAIACATDQMTRLVEDLLLLARTNATVTPTFEWISIPLDELLEDVVDLLQLQAEVKGIVLKLEISEQVYVKGNPIQIKRLFSNLVENALQYTSIGGTVTVSVLRRERFVFVSVNDTGIGIAPEHISLVFNRFWRADKARSCREGGSGLGLAIAQAIAQTHKGEITVKSQVGVGSCFQVRLRATSQ
ncbi:two-component sensor histidine kinase [Nostocales cyanobacterium HT-58-2]|nr:two-component sensor histidine kinase [Nostocales cyanobacterium HT-58-2]